MRSPGEDVVMIGQGLVGLLAMTGELARDRGRVVGTTRMGLPHRLY